MKRFGTLLLIALITFAVVFFISRPEVLEQIWLWVIGLAGGVVAVVKRILNLNQDDDRIENNETQTSSLSPVKPEVQALIDDDFKGTTLTVLRYVDDGTTTLGLLYLNGHYYCYTLEDTHQDVKVPGETRIPEGQYAVSFLKQETPLTTTYRNRFDWFTYHLEIGDVEGFQNVYIHSGGDHNDTKGCLLVSDSLNTSEGSNFFTNSRNTFKQLYQHLEKELNNGSPVRLIVRDETWLSKLIA